MKKHARGGKKVAEKIRAKSRKRGRPRKSLRELKVSGGYDRNPGRLLKRLGLSQHQTLENAESAESAAAWDEFFEDGEKLRKIDQAYREACRLDDRGEHKSADKILLKAGVTPDVVKQRRAHLDWMEKHEDRSTDTAR